MAVVVLPGAVVIAPVGVAVVAVTARQIRVAAACLQATKTGADELVAAMASGMHLACAHLQRRVRIAGRHGVR